jgi:hypothetical protein
MAQPDNTTFRQNYAVPPGKTLKKAIESMGMTEAETGTAHRPAYEDHQ